MATQRSGQSDIEQADIEKVTIAHYEHNATAFWAGTRDHDVSQNHAALLQQFPAGKTLDILDFGCGPGRDLRRFREQGHRPVGLDGCETFCRMAREHAGCEVWQQHFLQLDLPAQRFDAIFANASLFHVPSRELSRVLRELHATLSDGGILFTSNPRGNGEGWSGERYGLWLEFDDSRRYLEQAGFTVIDHYYRPDGLPRAQQPWLAIVSRKTISHEQA